MRHARAIIREMESGFGTPYRETVRTDVVTKLVVLGRLHAARMLYHRGDQGRVDVIVVPLRAA